eukprot:GFUD01084307.1.p1 GENE.GFUD01084307.1~~GFUD01084307.1.p1  ORF type:complete len:247 (-),score=74.91 GFUD01084307.1:107-847(-)
MDRKNSLNVFTSPVVHIGKERKRLYSWSRPSKHLPRNSQAQSQLTINGKATLAFSPDGKWFQGNIISPTEDAYTISGRRKSVSSTLHPATEHAGSSDQSSPPILTSTLVCCSTTQTSLGSGDSPSDIDSLDSELVRAAIENFTLDEYDCDVLYDIAIMDYETGVNHSLKSVGCQVSSDTCRLVGDMLSFQADTCNKGAMADMVIHKNIGQALTEQNMIVFQGAFSYTYRDLICFPIPQGGQGQWCL